MAKRRSVGKVGNRSAGKSMTDVARLFGAAEARFRKAEAEYLAAGSALETLRVQMLKHLGTSANVIGVGSKASAGKGRVSSSGPRAGSLGSYVLEVMKDGKDRGPSAVYEAVMKAGFKSKGTEKSRLVMVTQTMAKLSKKGLLSKKGHGVYTAAA